MERIYIHHDGTEITRDMILRWKEQCKSRTGSNVLSDKGRIELGLTRKQHNCCVDVGFQNLAKFFGI